MASKLSIWANAVKDRDGKCMHCGKVEDLHAHHIKPKSSHPELSLDVGNGITLCYGCHKKEHERNAPVRMRSKRPRRKTLERRIKELEAAVLVAKGQVSGFPNPWPAEDVEKAPDNKSRSEYMKAYMRAYRKVHPEKPRNRAEYMRQYRRT